MKNRICFILTVGLSIIFLTNCGTFYQNSQQSQLINTPLPSGLSESKSQNVSFSPLDDGKGWGHLMMNGAGNDALITLTDGSLRGGTIVQVTQDSLTINSANQNFTIARSDIAVVEIEGSSGALAGGIIGFLVSGVVLTLVASGGEEIPAEGWVLGISLLGIPGGLLGALIGSQVGGDEVIVP
jgi:hypothetical protein